MAFNWNPPYNKNGQENIGQNQGAVDTDEGECAQRGISIHWTLKIRSSMKGSKVDHESDPKNDNIFYDSPIFVFAKMGQVRSAIHFGAIFLLMQHRNAHHIFGIHFAHTNTG